MTYFALGAMCIFHKCVINNLRTKKPQQYVIIDVLLRDRYSLWMRPRAGGWSWVSNKWRFDRAYTWVFRKKSWPVWNLAALPCCAQCAYVAVAFGRSIKTFTYDSLWSFVSMNITLLEYNNWRFGYRDSQVEWKKAVRLSYLYDGNFYAWTTSLYIKKKPLSFLYAFC